MNEPPPATEQCPWRAAQERVNARDIQDGEDDEDDDEEDESTGYETRTTRRRPDNEYCSNELKQRATRERLIRETGRACLRIQAGEQKSWLTPPLNAYYRRLCHQLAAACGLSHTTVAAPGDADGESKATHRTKPTLCGSTCGTKWCGLSLDQAPADRCVLICRGP